ncbi:DUF6660 domain-containing protein [Pontibacter korlensis]
MSLLLTWSAWQPCTDKIVGEHEHVLVVDPADTTGESPFHEDTCPIFCVCHCCVTLTIVSNEFVQLVFREFVEPQAKPLHFDEQEVKSISFSLWHPPRVLV